MKREKPATTQKEQDFDIAAEKAMKKQAAKTIEQHGDDLSIYKGPLY